MRERYCGMCGVIDETVGFRNLRQKRGWKDEQGRTQHSSAMMICCEECARKFVEGPVFDLYEHLVPPVIHHKASGGGRA